MKLLHVLSTIVLAAGMTAGCAHQRELEAQVADLTSQVEALETDVHDVCMMAGEISTMGMHIYLGDDVWLNRMSGETESLPELQDSCLEALEGMREALESEDRSSLLKQHKAATPPAGG